MYSVRTAQCLILEQIWYCKRNNAYLYAYLYATEMATLCLRSERFIATLKASTLFKTQKEKEKQPPPSI